MSDPIVLIDAEPIRARELTVLEVERWLERVQQNTAPSDDVASFLFSSPHLLASLADMTGLAVEAIKALTPSAIIRLREACERANPHFFAGLERMEQVVRKIQSGMLTGIGTGSGEPSSGLSEVGIPVP